MTRIPGAPLVDQLASLIERTYDATSRLVPLGRFIVGDIGYRLLVARGGVSERVAEPRAPGRDGARVLLRPIDGDGAWAAALYLPDAMVEHLERDDPRAGLGPSNVDAFATLVEEIDHLVTFADRVCRKGRDVSLLELEWHAAVTKYLVLGHFIGRLTGSPRLTSGERVFIEHHLFHKSEFADSDPLVRARYRDATRLAIRFVRRLGEQRPAERVSCLRAFHRSSHHQKLRCYS